MARIVLQAPVYLFESLQTIIAVSLVPLSLSWGFGAAFPFKDTPDSRYTSVTCPNSALTSLFNSVSASTTMGRIELSDFLEASPNNLGPIAFLKTFVPKSLKEKERGLWNSIYVSLYTQALTSQDPEILRIGQEMKRRWNADNSGVKKYWREYELEKIRSENISTSARRFSRLDNTVGDYQLKRTVQQLTEDDAAPAVSSITEESVPTSSTADDSNTNKKATAQPKRLNRKPPLNQSEMLALPAAISTSPTTSPADSSSSTESSAISTSPITSPAGSASSTESSVVSISPTGAALTSEAPKTVTPPVTPCSSSVREKRKAGRNQDKPAEFSQSKRARREERYAKMEPTRFWYLRSGRAVEEILQGACLREGATVKMLSFTIDFSCSATKKLFTQDVRGEITAKNDFRLPSLPPTTIQFLKTMQRALIKGMPARQAWPIMNELLDDMDNIFLIDGEKCGIESSKRRNQDRQCNADSVTARKQVGRKLDLVVRDVLEQRDYMIVERMKEWDEYATKFLRETAIDLFRETHTIMMHRLQDTRDPELWNQGRFFGIYTENWGFQTFEMRPAEGRSYVSLFRKYPIYELPTSLQDMKPQIQGLAHLLQIWQVMADTITMARTSPTTIFQNEWCEGDEDEDEDEDEDPEWIFSSNYTPWTQQSTSM
ncbi:hypothetical protein BGZ98_008527 [Dissophora globulifera]|nr:hypothetical protein BGZ98_008527 [Dissophora globulifera]